MRFKTDKIFELGIFLLPFENFFFAPSAGWATITPVIFLLYLVLNIKRIKPNKILLFFLLTIVLSIANYLSIGFSIERMMGTLITIFLGLSSLFACYIYYEKNHDITKVVKLLLTSYTISIVVGIVEFITIKGNISFLYKIFDFITKRNYMTTGRIQFTFTEPSFISVHLYGILLPLYLITKEKKILKVMIYYILLCIIFKSSMRFILDTFIVGTILLFDFFRKNNVNKYLFIFPILIILGIGTFNYIYNSNSRFRHFIDKGVYSDASSASRFFRINASIHGYKKRPLHFLVGYGLGNSIIPINDGYYDAYLEYENAYKKEIENLKNLTDDDNSTFCMYIRLISEFGVIIFGIVIMYLTKIYLRSSFKYKLSFFLINLYIYIQFDSYAFYSIWLFILLMCFTRNSYIERRQNENSTN